MSKLFFRQGFSSILILGFWSILIFLAILYFGATSRGLEQFGLIGQKKVSEQNSKAFTLVETLKTKEGTVINMYTDKAKAVDVYGVLLANGLVQKFELVRVDVIEGGLTSVNIGGGTTTDNQGNTSYRPYPATMQINLDDYIAFPNYTVGHQIGEVWANYYKWTFWQNSWDRYLKARGVDADSRVDLTSSSCWSPKDIIADDYYAFFGVEDSKIGPVCNSALVPARNVAGLRDFLAKDWTNNDPPAAYFSASPVPSIAPAPAPSAAPQK